MTLDRAIDVSIQIDKKKLKMKKIYKYFIIAFLLLTTKGFAQIGLPSKPEVSMTFDHPFLDASNYSNGVPNNQNKGLYFPTTDLTKWTFKTDNLDGITFPTAFNGMMVYNTGSGYTMSDVSKSGKVVLVKPGFYYFQNSDNEEGTSVSNGSWKPIGSSGSSLMEVGPDPCTAVAADGTGCDNEFTVTDPDCPGGPFSIVVVGGSDYASIAEKDETVGSFRLSFLANNSINVRAVIVRVTSSCTGLYKDFLFTQLGQPCDSGLGTVPPITSTPSGKNISFCAGGAVYLSIPHTTPNLDQIIWTRNSVEVARGVNSITVTQAGVYDVFMGNIGCNNIAGNAITVTRDAANTAPSPIDFIVAGNNGVACGLGGTVELIVSSTTSGTIAWYHNGVKTTKNTTKIQATAGDWFAVVENGACSSLPTNTIKVVENYEGGSIAAPVMKINGETSNWNLCKGGSMFLEVVNPEVGVNYTWYINNQEIGTGSGIYYLVPSSDEFVIRLRATGTGCSKETLAIQTVGTIAAPNAPTIISSTNNVLCGGTTTLTAVNTNATAYRWFKDGVFLEETTTPSLVVTDVAAYTVYALNGSCISLLSSSKSIALSDFATLDWTVHPTTATVGDTKAYMVAVSFSQGATYVWSVTDNAGAPTTDVVITNGQGTAAASFKFNATGTYKIVCNAQTACGDTTPAFVEQTVVVDDICKEPSITGTSATNLNLIAGNTRVLSVTATGTMVTYQWYKNTTEIDGATAATYVYTAPSTPTTDVLYCEVKSIMPCNDIAKSANFNITVSGNPEALPTGSGSFSGKICYDIAKSNFNSDCGFETNRSGQKTDFTIRTAQDPALAGNTVPYSGVQVYTFVPSGTVSNVRFQVVDNYGDAVDSYAPNADYSGGGINTPCKLTINFNKNLNDILLGKTRTDGYQIYVYVIYKNGTTDVKQKLTLSLQDCACCGAKTFDGKWLTFMCHNLGADESLDPFTYVEGNEDGSNGTLGSLYQWGRITDGHQKRNSKTTWTLATDIKATNIAGLHYNRNGWWTYDNLPRTTTWGNGTLDANPPKGPNDPCPAGYKVPSMQQMVSIFKDPVSVADNQGFASSASTANTWTLIPGKGFKVGESLFLPLAGFNTYVGYRSGYNNPTNKGIAAAYWTSTLVTGTDSPYFLFYNQQQGFYPRRYGSSVSYAYSVRCVQDN